MPLEYELDDTSIGDVSNTNGGTLLTKEVAEIISSEVR